MPTNEQKEKTGLKIIFKNRKLLIVFLPIILILCCCSSCLILSFIGNSLPPDIKLLFPENTSSTSEEPNIPLKLKCLSNTYTFLINDKELSEDEVQNLCGQNGYNVKLQDGINTFTLKAKNTFGKESSIELNISFDLNTYNHKLAQEEEKRKEEETERIRQEEETKKKTEEEEKANAEADAIALSEFKTSYFNTKETIIQPTFDKSSKMITAFGNSTDIYYTRNLAISYKNYFLSSCRTDMSPVPEVMTEDVNKLNDFFSQFCLYNWSLADATVNYCESDSTEEQFELLDEMTYNIQQIANMKVSMEVHMSAIEEKLK